jgi:hypothetical protein
MSERESVRAGLSIFTTQLTQVTFTDEHDDIDVFFARFDAILDGIQSLTHSTFSSPIKKTMLEAQLRGRAAKWAWRTSELKEMGYERVKDELRRRFGRDTK